jgi:ribosome maturation factor RimP
MDIRFEVIELATPLADELGFEIVDVEYVPAGGRWTIRVYLDRPGGITLDDCARFSRRLGDLLEMNQTLPHAYVIEVSSPGIERRLKTSDHFRRFVGRRAHIETHEPWEGRRHVEGSIAAATESEVTLALDEGGSWTVPLTGVRVARLVVDPWNGRRSAEGPNHQHRRGKQKKRRHR